MSKIRINDLARELEVKSKAILDALPEVGVTEKKTHSSSVEEHEAEKVRAYLRGASEAQASTKHARSTRVDSDEIKTKIDLSNISRPGDVSECNPQATGTGKRSCSSRPSGGSRFTVSTRCEGSRAAQSRCGSAAESDRSSDDGEADIYGSRAACQPATSLRCPTGDDAGSGASPVAGCDDSCGASRASSFISDTIGRSSPATGSRGEIGSASCAAASADPVPAHDRSADWTSSGIQGTAQASYTSRLRRERLRGRFRDVRYRGSLFFSVPVRAVRLRVRALRCVRVNVGRCIQLGSRLRVRVLWELVRDCLLRVRPVPAPVRVRLRADPASAMFHEV